MTHRSPRHIVAAIAAPVALLVALLAWGVSSPPGSSADEDYHMGSIWCAGGLVEGRCEQGADEEHRLIPADVALAAECFAFRAEQAATCPLAEGEMESRQRGNWFDNGYPPVFYAAMNVFVSDDLSTSIVLMRSVNAIAYVGILTGLFFLLPRRQRTVLVWGALISIVPLGLFLVPSVNPSGWAVLQATGLWLAVWGYYLQRGPKKLGLAAVATLLMVMGAGARSDSAIYGVIGLLVAGLFAFRPNRRFFIESLLPLALAVFAVAMFFSGGQSGVISAGTDHNQSIPALVFANVQLLPQLWAGSLGLSPLGWLDTEMPELVWLTTTGLFAALVFAGLRTGDWRKWLSMLGVGAALVVLPMYILVSQGILVGTGVQARYTYPLLIIFGAVALVGLAGRNLGMGRLQLVVVAIGLSIANSVALHVNLRRYVTGLDVSDFNLNRHIEWWWNAPLSPMAVWAIGSVAFAALLAVLAAVAWAPARERIGALEDQRADGAGRVHALS